LRGTLVTSVNNLAKIDNSVNSYVLLLIKVFIWLRTYRVNGTINYTRPYEALYKIYIFQSNKNNSNVMCLI